MDDDLLVVVAHSLINPVTGCQAGARLLLERDGELQEAVRDQTLQHIKELARFTSELLLDLVRGGSDGLLDALDELGRGQALGLQQP